MGKNLRFCRRDRTINPAMSQPQTNKNKKSLPQFWTVWWLIVILALGASGFWGWKYMTMSAENERFEVSIKNTSQRITELQPGDANLSRRRAEIAKKADNYRINWSVSMAQVFGLETKSARFESLDIQDNQISAIVNATSWDTLSSFVDALKQNPEVSKVRVSTTNELDSAIAGATQQAKLSFLFNPKSE